MSTVIGVMDRNSWTARTDVIVVVDTINEAVTWVPRDLYVTRIKNRINTAYQKGQHHLLIECLRDLGFHADHSICLLPEMTARALADVEVTVPVKKRVAFVYPATPLTPIHISSKIIRFEAPSETLRGERIHQWLGARLSKWWQGSDIDRIRRHPVFVKELMKTKFDFRKFLTGAVSDNMEAVVADVSKVKMGWKFIIFDNVRDATIDGYVCLLNNG